MDLRKVGFIYDDRFTEHKHPRTGSTHPECPERVAAPYKVLKENNVLEKLVILPSRFAEKKDLVTTLESEYIEKLKTAKNGEEGLCGGFDDLSKVREFMTEEALAVFGEDRFSTYINEKTSDIAFLSAGSALQLVKASIEEKIESGFALIRPPGHHAGTNYAGGFCYFNNVAIAAKYAQANGVKNILIVDWDIHHGNGTQDIFYNDNTVLYLSIHRYHTFPRLESGRSRCIGESKGLGYNVNIAWDEALMGEREYKYAFNEVVLPIATKFKPDLILVSCGFDAARGDLIGEFDVTINTYSWMTARLLEIGKTLMFYEGGYNIENLCEGVHTVINTLLGEMSAGEIVGDPNEIAKKNVTHVKEMLKGYWF